MRKVTYMNKPSSLSSTMRLSKGDFPSTLSVRKRWRPVLPKMQWTTQLAAFSKADTPKRNGTWQVTRTMELKRWLNLSIWVQNYDKIRINQVLSQIYIDLILMFTLEYEVNLSDHRGIELLILFAIARVLFLYIQECLHLFVHTLTNFIEQPAWPYDIWIPKKLIGY